MRRKLFLCVTITATIASCLSAQNKINYAQIANYDEAAIMPYEIPDALLMNNGSRITTTRQWEKHRGELLETMQKEMYGIIPKHPKDLHFKQLTIDNNALGGLATRKEIKVCLTKDESVYFVMLMYIPNGVPGPVPAFIGLNFKGNVTICDDPGISFPTKEKQEIFGWKNGKTWEDAGIRGTSSSRWPVEQIMKAGYALATIYYEDIALDRPGEPFNGVLPMGYGLAKNRKPNLDFEKVKKEVHPVASEWGSIGAWAWGLSCSMDYLVKDKALDPDRIIVMGHSRLGKTALWAAAMDQRFAMAITNASGCCGAALSRRMIGETLAAVDQNFPQWFTPAFSKYNNKEHLLPFDEHQLIALEAPRPVYIVSCSRDGWADPHGEFLSGVLAGDVYALYGKKSVLPDPAEDNFPSVISSGYYMSGPDRGVTGKVARDGGNAKSDKILRTGYPAVDTPLENGWVAYYLHEGVHAITSTEWTRYIAFANKTLK